VRVFDDLQGADTKDVGMSVPELWICARVRGVRGTYRLFWPIHENLTGGEHPQRTESVATAQLLHDAGRGRTTGAAV